MLLLCFVLCFVILSVECSAGKEQVTNLTTDEAFKHLKSSLYCAPNGTYVYYDSTLRWLTFNSKTLPSKYQLPNCSECGACTEAACSYCVPRLLGTSCTPCNSTGPWPPPQNPTSVSLRCLGCLFGRRRVKIRVTPCRGGLSFNWLGWIAGLGKKVICTLANGCGTQHPKPCCNPQPNPQYRPPPPLQAPQYQAPPQYPPPQVVYPPPQVVYQPPQVVYQPPQVVYQPPQVVYAPPQVVYAPPQVVYAPPQVVYPPQPNPQHPPPPPLQAPQYRVPSQYPPPQPPQIYVYPPPKKR